VRRPWIKVCGVTRAADAAVAVAAGARAVGFVLVPESPRCIAADRAAAIARDLPGDVARVGVVSGRDPEAVRRLVRKIGLTAVQAHGEESPEACRSYGVPVVKAFNTGDGFRTELLDPYREFAVLLDAPAGTLRGGTGRRADWEAARAAGEAGHRVLLAGGLSPGNLAAAVRAVEPLAVDLNSGVETAPGIKDAARIRDAVRALDALPFSEEAPWPW
jgi:phosphoribosylanthranilate isomerase